MVRHFAGFVRHFAGVTRTLLAFGVFAGDIAPGKTPNASKVPWGVAQEADSLTAVLWVPLTCHAEPTGSSR